MDKPRMVGILDVTDASLTHKTYTLDVEVDARPGQFCMLWIPRVNEKPMSISNTKGKVQVTVKKIGDFTERLFELGRGDKIGFRGPYGKGFEYVAGDVLLVGGGCGIAPLRPLKDVLKGHVVVSARTVDQLLFEKEFADAGFNVHVATDDGSKGFKGFAHQLVEELLKEHEFKCVFCCGPEPMMRAVLDVCTQANVSSQMSLERYMKCGIGICGSCTISGLRVCREGPVFKGETLLGTEFGHYTKDASGVRRKHNGC
ncbi:MAG: dihydroorotate dehydrogenase electron transfer subunit [Candidatus Altiarchaeota archaeon]|nr:dihydroorotate dehydrogenase electron transfer subunit [Candidatus Altiarchaeota archaeon]